MANLIKIKQSKDIIVNKKLLNYLNPDFVYIPLEKGFKLAIKTGDELNKEDIILCEGNNYIYSPISGKVLGAAYMTVGEANTKVVVIENDFREKNKKLAGTKRFINKYTKEEVMALAKEFNAYKGSYEGKILVVNGLDLEPHVFTNSYLITQHVNEILEAVDALYSIFELDKCLFAIKNNDTENVDELVNHIGTYPNIDLRLLPDLYPLGEKTILINELVSKKEQQNGIFYLTVAEVYAIYNVLKRKRPITEVLVTVTGDNITKGGVLNVKIGTSLKDVIRENFELIEDKYRVIINGLMSGYEIKTLDYAITPDITSVFIMKKPNYLPKKCINCGMCHTKCPHNCDPRSNYKMQNCSNCGICSYICPANINFKRKEKN